MILFLNLLYLVLVLFFVLSASFIVYHLVRFSLSKAESTITLFVFLSIFITLLFSNLALFFSIRFDQVVSIM